MGLLWPLPKITLPKSVVVVALVRYSLEYLFSPSNFGYIVQNRTFNTRRHKYPLTHNLRYEPVLSSSIK